LKNPTEPLRTNHKGDVKAMVKLNKTDEQVIAALKEGKELTLQEIAEKTGETSKKVFKSLRKLFENELITTNARKYKLCEAK
jgi:predicted transcriptional regulator